MICWKSVQNQKSCIFRTLGGPQREDLDLAASAGRFGIGGKGNNNYNQRFRWQEPPGKIIFVLFCFATCRDEEKETQNINVVGKKPGKTRGQPGGETRGTPGENLGKTRGKPRGNPGKTWGKPRVHLDKHGKTQTQSGIF